MVGYAARPSRLAAIEWLQPYSGCDWTKALRDLSNRDKHREFVSIKGDYTVLLGILESVIRISTLSAHLYVAHHIPSMGKWM